MILKWYKKISGKSYKIIVYYAKEIHRGEKWNIQY